MELANGDCGVRHELVDGMAALAAPLHLTPKHPAAPAGWAQPWRRAHSLEGGLVESGVRHKTLEFCRGRRGRVGDA